MGVRTLHSEITLTFTGCLMPVRGFSHIDNRWGFFVGEDYMNEPESISNIIDGLIECFYLERLEEEADKWDAMTCEQKYGIEVAHD